MRLTRSFTHVIFAAMLRATPKAVQVAGDGFAMNAATGAMPSSTRQTAITFAKTVRNRMPFDEYSNEIETHARNMGGDASNGF